MCGGQTINSWASRRAQGGQFHRLDRQGSVALTADGAVIKNKISNTNTDANTNTETHIQAQTGRIVGNSLGRPGRVVWP